MTEPSLARQLVDSFEEVASGETTPVPCASLLHSAAMRLQSRTPLVNPVTGKVEWAESDAAKAADLYGATELQGRGAWYLPDRATVRTGWLNALATAASATRYFGNETAVQATPTELSSTPDGTAIWSLLEPFADDLWGPVRLRFDATAPKEPERQREAWAAAEATLSELGLDLPTAPFTYGGQWAASSRDERLALIGDYADALAMQLSADVCDRWTLQRLRTLAQAYLRKSKKGPADSTEVLTKAHQRTLIGLFGGDWFEFVAHVGEQPSPGEQRHTELPAPRIFIPASQPAAAGTVSSSELQAIQAAVLGGADNVNAVPERVDLLRTWWLEITDTYRRHTPQDGSYLGLLGGGLFSVDDYRMESPAYLAQHVLSQDTVTSTQRLWDGRVFGRWPHRIASEFNPQALAAETFGLAGTVWHNIMLSCWYSTEGPYALVPISTAQEHYANDLKVLSDLGFPIEEDLFDLLRQTDDALGPPGPIERTEQVSDTVNFTMSIGERRDGYQQLRDIVVRHLDRWNEAHLDTYLESRWRHDVEAVANEISRAHTRGKKLTNKQLGKMAAPAANHWFCGDIRALLRSVGEPAPFAPERIDLLVGDPLAFVEHLYVRLGGRPPELWGTDDDASAELWTRRQMAREALRWIQHREASGEWPTLGTNKAGDYQWDLFGLSPEQGWAEYLAIVDELRQQDLQRLSKPPISAVAVEPAETPQPQPPEKKRLLRRLIGR